MHTAFVINSQIKRDFARQKCWFLSVEIGTLIIRPLRYSIPVRFMRIRCAFDRKEMRKGCDLKICLAPPAKDDWLFPRDRRLKETKRDPFADLQHGKNRVVAVNEVSVQIRTSKIFCCSKNKFFNRIQFILTNFD